MTERTYELHTSFASGDDAQKTREMRIDVEAEGYSEAIEIAIEETPVPEAQILAASARVTG